MMNSTFSALGVGIGSNSSIVASNLSASNSGKLPAGPSAFEFSPE